MFHLTRSRTASVRLGSVLVLLVAVLALATQISASASVAAPGEVATVEAPAIAAAAYPEGLCESTASHRTIQEGNSGESVKHVQCLLNEYWGFNLAVDGDFGPRTDDAVEYVQSFVGIDVDGIVGHCTWPVLHLELLPDDCI